MVFLAGCELPDHLLLLSLVHWLNDWLIIIIILIVGIISIFFIIILFIIRLVIIIWVLIGILDKVFAVKHFLTIDNTDSARDINGLFSNFIILHRVLSLWINFIIINSSSQRLKACEFYKLRMKSINFYNLIGDWAYNI